MEGRRTLRGVLDLWSTLIPLALGSAIIPVEIALTILVLKTPGGVPKALAWVGGMTAVRLAQWVVLGPIVETAVDDGQPGTSLVEGRCSSSSGFCFSSSPRARRPTSPTRTRRRPGGWR